MLLCVSIVHSLFYCIAVTPFGYLFTSCEIFPVLGNYYRAAVNSFVQVFVWMCVSISFQYLPVELLDIVSLRLTFEETSFPE